jgi:hypothetical protein
MQQPQFCADLFGDITRNEGSILAQLGIPCAEEAGNAAGNLFSSLGKMATVAQLGMIARGAAEGAAGAAEGGAGGSGKRAFSSGDRAAGWEKAKDANGVARCQYCGTKLTPESGSPNSYEADHGEPWSLGGKSELSNLVPSCRTCNRSKGGKTISEWLGL